MESCQFVVLGSLGGRSGSVLDVGNRLRRKRGRFDRGLGATRVPRRSPTGLEPIPDGVGLDMVAILETCVNYLAVAARPDAHLLIHSAGQRLSQTVRISHR